MTVQEKKDLLKGWAKLATTDFNLSDSDIEKIVDAVLISISTRTNFFKVRFKHKFDEHYAQVDFNSISKSKSVGDIL
jgi:hypothetical protein